MPGLRRRSLSVTAGSAATAAALAVLLAVTPALSATADGIRDREYWLDSYGIRAAWTTTKGAGQTIAIIDTGIDSSHPDLAGAVVGGADFSGLGAADGQRPVGSDDPEHGTLVASLAAGRGTGGGAGVIGAAPAASLLAVSIGFGDAAGDSDDQIAQAVRWSVDNGATVINMSLTRGTRDWPESWDDAFLYAMEHDVVVVAAAGNRGSGTVEVGAPATMPGVLTVGGVDRSGTASFDASTQGITIGVSAPSEDLVGALPGGGHALWSGTSGAAPIVAGIVALVRAAHPDLDAANVIQRLTATAKDAGDPGADFLYGFGLVDARAAVSADVAAVTANPMGDLADWIRLYRRGTASPAPTESAPAPSGTPTAGPADEAAPWNPLGRMLPTPNQLVLVAGPAAGLGALLAIWAVFAVSVLRRVRSGRARR